MIFERNANNIILTIKCPTGIGIVAAATNYLASQNCYIRALEQFDSPESENFFIRLVFSLEKGSSSVQSIREGFEEVARKFKMEWQFHEPRLPVKTILMVSKFDHCLVDLLYRRNKGELNLDVTAIVSNHETCRAIAEREKIRFVHLPIDEDKKNKLEQEQKLEELFEETGSELVILARYMQILSSKLSSKVSGRCINIHHSFLPGFKGAAPYRQAFNRGVKVIGATAHYVTSDLDEGPIIEQVLSRVDHNYSPSDLSRVGRDNESVALAKAVKYHVEQRVFLDGDKTVVFLGS